MTEPRWLSAEGAARHLSVRVDAFLRMVRQGRVPAPSYALGPRTPRWDRQTLDAAIEPSTASTDPRTAVAALVQEIEASGRARRALRQSGRHG